ncbi:phage tail protein [Salmonella enterica]|uniref:Phage tail protein n=1 Tax=Salmonella enterica subsp. houtenae serovar 50:g,z51:- TaxID=1173947 RepID=A0A2K0J9M3_SALHO|nr:phage tail protein [Salmonella enterica]ECI4039533.1 phage tail protein [Salmonella enterica subsp. houtenae]ECT8750152.1 phage tail protein [Salmonella enterica subsp. enterica serovar Adelaide]ESE92427.1 gp19 [Salmonella enterica subsp. houtenae serovar 50:g,z51:- str. 01-0133]PNO31965.1 phage tail protein [Salmonella enterica subsp. houtenae serovar 50:g,z51:-]
MSQTTITRVFEQWKAQQGATGEPVLLDEFVFANVPGLEPDRPVDRNETLPPAEQIVHRQAVSRKGVVNDNAVVHSVVLGADVGDFSFNWIGLLNKASGTLAMIVHAPLQQKLKTAEGQQGNVLTRSFLMEYNGAQAETGINTPAETWQIDFTARMAGMDERQRLENIDIFGAAAFFGDGWLVGKSGNQFYVTKGTGYVAGLRTTLAENLSITVTTRPVKVWLDVCWTGTLTSVWGVQSRTTVADNLADYVQNGVQHYVFAVAGIDENGNITDLRPKGTLNEQQASDALRKHEQSRNHPDATTREKGFVQLSSDTNSESESLAATPKAVKAAMDNANGRLAKNNNGGDIPDKGLFAQNISAALAFGGGVSVGGDANPWTTAEFIAWLESCGAFNHPYWMCKGSWDYAGNKVITDTGCGNICLAGAVIEVMGTRGAMTIRITTPTTTSGGGVPSAQFIYINHGDGYAPGWRREFSRTGDGMTGNLYLKNEGRINLAIVDEAETPRMWLFKDKGGDGVHLNNGNDGGGDFVFGKEGSFYAPLAVRAGGSKMLSVRSDNNSALSAHFNLWGGGNRPTVIELDDEQGWHLYSQRNPDGTISFTVNGIVYCTALNVGGAIYQNNGDIYGSVWGNSWLSTWIHNNVVRGVRLGPVALSGGLWRDFQLGGGQVITGFHTEGDWEMQGGDDKVYYRPVQYLVGDTWVTAPSV